MINLQCFIISLRQAPYGMVEELIEKLLSEHQEEDDKCLSEPSSCPPGATFTIVFIFPICPAANFMLRAPKPSPPPKADLVIKVPLNLH